MFIFFDLDCEVSSYGTFGHDGSETEDLKAVLRANSPQREIECHIWIDTKIRMAGWWLAWLLALEEAKGISYLAGDPIYISGMFFEKSLPDGNPLGDHISGGSSSRGLKVAWWYIHKILWQCRL